MKKTFLAAFLLLAVAATSSAQNRYNESTYADLAKKINQGNKDLLILDVRTTGEFADTIRGGRQVGIGRLKGAVNIPMQDFLQKPETINQIEGWKDKEIFVTCSHSYRSRTISNLLLEHGFSNVNNLQGGMSEWFRNYQELAPYMDGLYETSVNYHNLAPAKLFTMIQEGEALEFIGFRNPPRFPFDSMLAALYPVFPDIKKTSWFAAGDSLRVLERVKAGGDKKYILFNTVGQGAPETAEWLAGKGYSNVYYLVGNLTGLFEYLANYQPSSSGKILSSTSKISFFTPMSFCKHPPSGVQWIDLRHDTTFNKITRGTKLAYSTLRSAMNFPYYRSADEFAKAFPDREKTYMIIPERGYTGIDLAMALTEKGYHIGWLLGGIERWEWYTNNVNDFTCGKELLLN